MSHNCPACQHTFDADALAGVVCCPRCGRSFEAALDATAIVSEGPSTDDWTANKGEVFAGYTLERKIGQGGMAEVWIAKKNDTQQVIKILLKRVADNEAIRKRFMREIDSLQRFDHPHIIPITDHGDSNGRLYYVTPTVAKHSLRNTIDTYRQGGLTAKALKHIAFDCLQALKHAHQENIIHRDIKPENILVLENGDYALSDFGIAQVHSSHEGNTLTMLTHTNVVLGTYAYMAPEQSKGSRDIDPRADLYALGVVLYECVSGNLPEGRFEDPAQFMKQWSASDRHLWNKIILCLLERDPNKRYPNADAVLAAIGNVTQRYQQSEVNPYPHGRTFYRYSEHGWFGGVCSGLGAYTGIDANWIRLAVSLSIGMTGGLSFIAYVAMVVLIPNCPDVHYQPKPLNAHLPKRGDGWFLGVCEMLGSQSANPGVWRLIFIFLCPLTSFIALIPYLAIGIICPAGDSRYKRMPMIKNHTKKHAKVPKEAEMLPSLWPAFLSALPAAAGFGYMSYLFYQTNDMVFTAIFAGFSLYFLSQLHTRRKLTPSNFNGLASGLCFAGSALLIGLCFIDQTPTTHMVDVGVTVTHYFNYSNILEIGLGLIAGGLVWSLLRGYYGAYAQILGFIPAVTLSHFISSGQLSLQFPIQPVLLFTLACILWAVCAHIAQHMLHWVINPPEEKERHYSLSATIISLSVVITAFILLTFNVERARSEAQTRTMQEQAIETQIMKEREMNQTHAPRPVLVTP